MNQVVEVTGTILDCNLIEDDKFFVNLIPDDPSILSEVEQRVEQLKSEPNPDPFAGDAFDFDEFSKPDNFYIYKDKVTKGCNFTFESINIPSLKGLYRDIDSNDQAIYKRARVLGSLTKMKGGNVCLFFHLVDSVHELMTSFDEEMEDASKPLEDDWLF